MEASGLVEIQEGYHSAGISWSETTTGERRVIRENGAQYQWRRDVMANGEGRTK